LTAAIRVRGTKNPDVTAIVDLAPDLVVANEEENRELDVRRLRDASVAVYVTRVRTVVEAADSLAALSGAVGVPAAGAELRDALLRAVDAVPDVDPPIRTFCPVWRHPWMATGRATFVADLLGRCGLTVVPADPEGRYPTVDLDDIAVHLPARLRTAWRRGKTLAVATGMPDKPGALTLWDVPTKTVRVVIHEKLGIRGVAFSPE
jgi:ABC-type Fe3+-hydroxamate transport system substrate-binding protein